MKSQSNNIVVVKKLQHITLYYWSATSQSLGDVGKCQAPIRGFGSKIRLRFTSDVGDSGNANTEVNPNLNPYPTPQPPKLRVGA